MKKAVVIGSGIAGLASACRLAKKGYQVSVFEANSTYGGKLDEIKVAGYRFDAGPSLFTMPQYLEELFEFCGEKLSSYFIYERMDESCRYFWEDGTEFTMHNDETLLKSSAKKAFGGDGLNIVSHLNQSQFIYDKIGHIFTEKSLHKIKTWMSWDVIKALPQIPWYGLNSSMDQKNQSSLKHPKLVQLFNRYATYNGSNPYQAPATLNLIPHLEHGFGTFFPKEGMRSIADSVFNLAKKLGVQFHFNTPVSSITVKNGSATAIECNNEPIEADVVVSNMDVYYTYTRLLQNLKLPRKIKTQERSSSAIIFYWGINRKFEKLGLHNILFSENYEAEFEHIFGKKTGFNDPTVYIHISSKVRAQDAPKRCENWFVMVNAPSDTGQNWDKLVEEQKAYIVEKIKRTLGVDIKEHIESENMLDPRKIDVKTSSYQGSLYGTSSNSKMAAFNRQKNKSNIKNLFFCGGSVHPGGGIPLCLMSAKIMNDSIPTV